MNYVMPKRILIPTDFSIESLNVLKSFLQIEGEKDQYDVVLSCGYYMSESITDLLFFSKYKILRGLNTDAFMDAVSIIQNKYSNSLRSVNVDLFTGSRQTTFNDYLEGQKIESIVYAEEGKFHKTFKKTFDLSSYIIKSNVNKITLGYKTSEQHNVPANDISVLFNTVGSFS